MTNEIIKKSIARNELELRFWDKISHFGIVIYFLIIPACVVFYNIKDVLNRNQQPAQEGEIFFFIIPILLSILFYLLQKKRLKFKTVDIKLNSDEIFKVFEETAIELDWTINKVGKAYLTASTNPKIYSGSWGEQITIIFTDNKIFINSICDLKKKTSLVSMGRNKKNVETFINNIKIFLNKKSIDQV